MRTLLHNCPLTHNDNVVCLLNCRQLVGNGDRSSIERRGYLRANLWLTAVSMARFHGQLYERLLSSRAMNLSQEDLGLSVQEVVTGLEEFGEKFAAWKSSLAKEALTKEPELAHIAYEVMRLSLLVIAY